MYESVLCFFARKDLGLWWSKWFWEWQFLSFWGWFPIRHQVGEIVGRAPSGKGRWSSRNSYDWCRMKIFSMRTEMMFWLKRKRWITSGAIRGRGFSFSTARCQAQRPKYHAMRDVLLCASQHLGWRIKVGTTPPAKTKKKTKPQIHIRRHCM